MPAEVTLYTGPHCSLCETAKALIAKVAEELPLHLTLVDISGDPELFARHRERIPVVLIDGREVMAGKVTEFWLRKALAGEGLDRFRLF